METGQIESTPPAAMRGHGIGWHISMLVTLAVVLAVGVITAFFVYNDINSDFRMRKHALEATGYVFAAALADHIASRDEASSLQVLRSISRIPEISYAAVTGNDGKVFASFGSAVVQSEGLETGASIV